MKIDPRSLKNRSKKELSEMLKSEDDDITQLALSEIIHRDLMVAHHIFHSQPSDQLSLFPDIPLDLDNITVAISESQQEAQNLDTFMKGMRALVQNTPAIQEIQPQEELIQTLVSTFAKAMVSRKFLIEDIDLFLTIIEQKIREIFTNFQNDST